MNRTNTSTIATIVLSVLSFTLSVSGDTTTLLLDTHTEPQMVESIDITYDASWIGGAAGATVVIRDNGFEVRRMTGAGEFTHTPVGSGRHELTYTTIIDGVEQEEGYSLVVYKGHYTVRFDANGGDGTMDDCEVGIEMPFTLPDSSFTKEGHFLFGWALTPGGEATLLDGDSTADLSAQVGETVTLYAVWHEGMGGGNGLTVKYYDISSSGYSTWTQSEAAMTNYFAAYAPTMEGNTYDWTIGLSSGNILSAPSSSDLQRMVNAGMTSLEFNVEYSRFHGKYSNASQSNFSVLFQGTMRIDIAGLYGFACIADDQIVIYIDGTRVCNTTWANCATSSLNLEKGLHRVVIVYRQNSGGHGFSAQWKKPGDSSYTPIPQSVLTDGKITTYAIRFEANGGEGMMAKRVYASDDNITLPANSFTRDGWTFLGWATEADGPVVFADEEAFDVGFNAANGETVTLYARWSRGQYAVHFDANGGDGAMADESPWLGIPDTLTPNAFTRIGYTFAGWATATDGGVAHGDGAQVVDLATAPNGEATLYAVWSPHEWTIRFFSEDDFIGSQVFAYDSPEALDGNTATKMGYTFAGWATEEHGEKAYDDGEEILNLTAEDGAVIDFHAIWTPNSYTVTFNANGGEGAMADMQFTYDEEQSLTANAFTRENRFFAGWAAAADGAVTYTDGEVVSNLTAAADGEVTLYAVWADSRVVFDANGGDGEMEKYFVFNGTEQTLPRGTFMKDGCFLLGWALTPDGEATLLDGDSTADIVAEAGETVTLYAVWHECVGGGNGLTVKYYDISSSGYSTWTQSEAAMTNYFANRTPTIITNTLDWGDSLDAGFQYKGSSSDANRVFSQFSGWNNVGTAATRFHGKYANQSQNYFAMLLEGVLSICAAGDYSFGIIADNAAVLYIDGTMICGVEWSNNAFNTIHLSNGPHFINVAFFEESGEQGLLIQWKKPGDSSYAPIPQSVLTDGKAATYAIRFDANGGAGTMAKRVYTSGDDVTLPANDFTRNGYYFLGWATTPDGPITFEDEEALAGGFDAAIGETTTLYAKWSQGQYTVRFNANGGEGTMADEAFWFGIPAALPPNAFTRSGYSFTGWSAPGAGEATIDAMAVVTNLCDRAWGVADLCAIWRHDDGDYSETVLGTTWHFTVNDGCATITGVSSAEGALVIPASLGGCRVTGIGDFAFSYCGDLTSVTIPDGVENIGMYAFYKCGSLASVTIPDSVTDIGRCAFSGCENLTQVIIDDLGAWNQICFGESSANPLAIAGRLYCNGTDVTERDATLSTCHINNLAAYCRQDYYRTDVWRILLYDVTNPTFDMDRLFINGEAVTDLVIPEGVSRIGYGAFFCCHALKTVTIPASVTEIATAAFAGCSNLEAFFVDANNPNYCAINGMLYTKDGKTLLCGKNGDVAIPEGTTNIVQWAFADYYNLTSLTIPSSLNFIGSAAFGSCDALQYVDIRDLSAWCGITFDRWNGDYESGQPLQHAHHLLLNGEEITNLDIPSGVTQINEWAFYGCDGIETVDIPDSVGKVCGASLDWWGMGAFKGCANLVLATVPRATQIEDGAFPDGCLIVWKEKTVLVRVDSAHGTPAYGGGFLAEDGGVVSARSNDVFTCSMSDAVLDNEDPRISYRCVGWTGTGSVPATGSGANVSFTAAGDSSITWLWETNVWIECVIDVFGETFPTNGWFAKDGGWLAIPIPVSVEPFACSVFGDLEGVTIDAAGRIALVPTDRPREVSVSVHAPAMESDVFRAGSAAPSRIASSWSVAADSSAADGYSLRSGETAANGTSAVEMTLTGPGALSFTWKVPAGRGDYARFYLDGTVQKSIQRTTSWQSFSIDIPAGSHTARWTYERGSGNATGEDAAFLDAVDWRPEVSLSVESAFGAPSPAAGANTLAYGDEVVARVVEPVAADGTRRVCTGWSGSGSVPADGEGNSVAFTLQEDSSLTWNWRTEHWVDVAATGDGSCGFEPQWVADGTQVVVALVPATRLHRITLSGDTEGVTLDGATLRFAANGPRTIRAAIEEVKISLGVESEWGVPSPTNGIHAISWGTQVEAYVKVPEPADGVWHVCTGWTGTGSVPASGRRMKTSFTVGEDSTLAWNWQTNVWVSLALKGPVSADFTEAWVVQGSNIVVRLFPSVPYRTFALQGDTNGVTLDETNLTLTIPADTPRSVSLLCEELTLAGALDAQGVTWTKDGDADWFPQVTVSADGEDAAKSGSVIGSEVSAIETILVGPGTFSWSWRIDSEGNAGVDVMLDGTWLDDYEPSGSWTRMVLAIPSGKHTIRFEFWNAGTAEHLGDCAYLDMVSWTPDLPLPSLAPGATPTAVTNAIASAGFDAGNTAALQNAIGGDVAKYSEFKAWAQTVKGGDGNVAGEAAVVASTNAAVSWLLGAEKLFVNEPTITISEMSVAGNDGFAGNGDVAPPDGVAFTLTVTVTDGENPVAVASEKVRGMFEATSDLSDWDGPHRLVPGVTEITGGSGSTLRFRVVPDSTGNSDRAFLRVKVK